MAARVCPKQQLTSFDDGRVVVDSPFTSYRLFVAICIVLVTPSLITAAAALPLSVSESARPYRMYLPDTCTGAAERFSTHCPGLYDKTPSWNGMAGIYDWSSSSSFPEGHDRYFAGNDASFLDVGYFYGSSTVFRFNGICYQNRLGGLAWADEVGRIEVTAKATWGKPTPTSATTNNTTTNTTSTSAAGATTAPTDHAPYTATVTIPSSAGKKLLCYRFDEQPPPERPIPDQQPWTTVEGQSTTATTSTPSPEGEDEYGIVLLADGQVGFTLTLAGFSGYNIGGATLFPALIPSSSSSRTEVSTTPTPPPPTVASTTSLQLLPTPTSCEASSTYRASADCSNLYDVLPSKSTTYSAFVDVDPISGEPSLRPSAAEQAEDASFELGLSLQYSGHGTRTQSATFVYPTMTQTISPSTTTTTTFNTVCFQQRSHNSNAKWIDKITFLRLEFHLPSSRIGSGWTERVQVLKDERLHCYPLRHQYVPSSASSSASSSFSVTFYFESESRCGDQGNMGGSTLFLVNNATRAPLLPRLSEGVQGTNFPFPSDPCLQPDVIFDESSSFDAVWVVIGVSVAVIVVIVLLTVLACIRILYYSSSDARREPPPPEAAETTQRGPEDNDNVIAAPHHVPERGETIVNAWVVQTNDHGWAGHHQGGGSPFTQQDYLEMEPVQGVCVVPVVAAAAP